MEENDELNKKVILVDRYLFKYFNYPIRRRLKKKNKLALLVETRCHYRLAPTIVNILYFLDDEYDFLFIGSLISVYYLKNVLPHLECYTEILEDQDLTWIDYSNIMMSIGLYEKYEYENIFTFQTDSVLLAPLPHSTYQHDFIGPADYLISTDDGVLICYGTGICFRKRSFILKCLNTLSHDDISQARTELGMVVCDGIYPEAYYYSQCLSIIQQKTIQSLDVTACYFFGQNKDINFKNVYKHIGAIHGYDKASTKHLSFSDLKLLFDYHNGRG